jgi:hypothetical protein
MDGEKKSAEEEDDEKRETYDIEVNKIQQYWMDQQHMMIKCIDTQFYLTHHLRKAREETVVIRRNYMISKFFVSHNLTQNIYIDTINDRRMMTMTDLSHSLVFAAASHRPWSIGCCCR